MADPTEAQAAENRMRKLEERLEELIETAAMRGGPGGITKGEQTQIEAHAIATLANLEVARTLNRIAYTFSLAVGTDP